MKRRSELWIESVRRSAKIRLENALVGLRHGRLVAVGIGRHPVRNRPVVLCVCDCGSDYYRLRKVSRLVAEAFIPNPGNLPIVNHIDNNRSNDTFTNLEWCTQAGNIAHANSQGRMQRNYWKGKRSPNAKLSNTEVDSIRVRRARDCESYKSLAKSFGVSKRTIGRIVNGENYAMA